jgi:hypothetical protein
VSRGTNLAHRAVLSRLLNNHQHVFSLQKFRFSMCKSDVTPKFM